MQKKKKKKKNQMIPKISRKAEADHHNQKTRQKKDPHNRTTNPAVDVKRSAKPHQQPLSIHLKNQQQPPIPILIPTQQQRHNPENANGHPNNPPSPPSPLQNPNPNPSHIAN